MSVTEATKAALLEWGATEKDYRELCDFPAWRRMCKDLLGSIAARESETCVLLAQGRQREAEMLAMEIVAVRRLLGFPSAMLTHAQTKMQSASRQHEAAIRVQKAQRKER